MLTISRCFCRLILGHVLTVAKFLILGVGQKGSCKQKHSCVKTNHGIISRKSCSSPAHPTFLSRPQTGILSMVACGMLQWQYIRHNVSKKSYYTIKYFTKALATASDAIIFLFFGIALLDGENYTGLRPWHGGFVAWSVVLCLVYRFLITGGLCLFANRFMRSEPIQKEEIIIMCYSG